MLIPYAVVFYQGEFAIINVINSPNMTELRYALCRTFRKPCLTGEEAENTRQGLTTDYLVLV